MRVIRHKKKRKRKRIPSVTQAKTINTSVFKPPDSWPFQEMSRELYDFLHRYRPKTWGDALRLIHDWEKQEQYHLVEEAAGQLDRSEFMTELLWHISFYEGPNGQIPYA